MFASRNSRGAIEPLVLLFVLLANRAGAQPIPIQIGDTVAGEIGVAGEVDVYEFSAAAGQVVFVDRTATSNPNGLIWQLEDRVGRILASNLSSLLDLGPVALMGGTYTLTILGKTGQTGTYEFRLVGVVNRQSSIAIGQTVSDQIQMPGQKVEYTFTAVAGQVVFLDLISSVTAGVRWTLQDEHGRALLPTTSSLSDAGPFPLAGGTYRLTVLGNGDAIQTYEFRVAEVIDDAPASVTIGDTVSGSIDVPGQQDLYTFSALAGQRIFLDQTATSNVNGLNWILEDEDGPPPLPRTSSLADAGPLMLVGGDYRLTVLGEGGATGTYTFRLLEVIDGAPVAIGVGDTVSGSIDVPGQKDVYSFTALTDQIVHLDQTATSNLLGLNWILEDSLGREVLPRTTSLADAGPFTLMGGDYRLTVLGEGGATGTYSFDLLDQGTGGFSPSGTPIAIGDVVMGSISASGEIDTYTFSVSAGQRLYFDLQAGVANLRWTALDPSGQAVFGPARAFVTTADDQGPLPLAAGTYSLRFEDIAGGTPSYRFQIWDVPAQSTTSIQLDELVSGSLSVPGSTVAYTFNVTEGRMVFLDVQTGSLNLTRSLFDPVGQPLFEAAPTGSGTPSANDWGPFPLRAGTHTLVLDATADATPAYQFRFVEPVQQQSGISIGALVTGTVSGPGDLHVLEFTIAGPAARLYFDNQAFLTGLFWTLRNEPGEAIFEDVELRFNNVADQGPMTLPAGTYRLELHPEGAAGLSYQFQIHTVTDEASASGFNQLLSGTLSGPGATTSFTLEAAEGNDTFFAVLQGSGSLRWSVYDEVGTPLFEDEVATSGGSADQGRFLLVEGTYRLVLYGVDDAAPGYQIRALAVLPAPPPQCPPGVAFEPERCDGVDNDCDGSIDETDAGNFDVYQNGVRLGTAGALSTAEPGAEFYRYERPVSASYNGVWVPAVLHESFVFVHRDPASGELSLILLHDRPSGTGGSADFELSGLDPGTSVTSGDDPFEAGAFSLDGQGNASFSWGWAACCTDGVVLAEFEPASGQCVSVTPDFTGGIDTWSFLSGDVLAPDRIPLALDVPIQVCPARCSHCPPPDLGGGQAPVPVELEPADGSVLPAGSQVILSGRVPTFVSRPLSAVLINGQPVDSLDAAGRFFKRVAIAEGDNDFTIEVLDRCAQTEETLTLVGSGTVQQGFDLLTDVTLQVGSLYSGTTFNEAAETLLVDAKARNLGGTILDGPLLLAFGSELAPSVEVLHAAGVTPQGEPYAVMMPEGMTLGPGQLGSAIGFAFGNPDRLPVRYSERWLAPANRPPAFISTPATSAVVSRQYTYTAVADDPDGHAVTYALELAPQAMTIGGQSGLIEWLPQASDEGLHELAVVASDGRGGRAEQRYHLSVAQPGPNRPPFFTTAPSTHAAIGAAYSYDAEAVDLDGDLPTYELLQAPSGMTVDSGSGLVSWPFTLPGAHAVRLRAADGQGDAAAQEWELSVGAPPANPSAPLITSVPQTIAAVGQRYVYQPVASDPDGDALTFALLVSPTGMGFDAQTGRMDWTPEAAQIGDHDVLLRVSDGRGGSAEQAFTISVLADPPERPPVFESVPPLFALAGVEYVYQAVATDPDFGTVTYSLQAGPSGAAIDSGTGRLTWTPAQQDAGTVAIGIQAEDPASATSSQVFLLLVRASNADPSIGSQPPGTVVAGQTYRYAVQATDADGDVLRFERAAGPAGLTIDPATGVVLWTPAAADLGLHPVTIAASDAFGGRTEQNWDLTVSADAQQPTVNITIARPEPFCLDQPIEVCVDASDDVGVAQRTLSADSLPLSLDLRGCTSLQKATPQTVALSATATDPSGNQGSDNRDAVFVDCDDPNAPVAEIVSPAPGSIITAPVDIVANITDNTPQVLTWEVKFAPLGSDQFTVIGSGFSEVSAGVVATFDPTVLPNDVYRIQIVGNDGAQTGGIEFQYGVAGSYKPGRFTLSFTDLAVPVAGVPLVITRSYDSYDTRPGEFGAGWRLGLSGNVTDSAAESRTGNLFVDQLANEAFTRTTRVYVTRPDGERIGFTFDPVSTGFPAPMYLQARFRADPGVDDTLELADGEPEFGIEIGGRFFNVFVPFNPKRYVLKTKSLMELTYDEDAGLQHIVDANGNTIDVTPQGLFSSTGVSLSFERDGEGRITKITEPDDPNDADPPGELNYSYSGPGGDLTVFRNQAGEEIHFYYEDPNFPHYLTKVEDPLGRPVVRTVFDEDGRIVGQCDENGNPATLAGCITFDYDVAGGVQTIVDARGSRTDLFFDARGNVLTDRHFFADNSTIDSSFEYDANDRLITWILPGDHRWTYTYDERGNLLSITDPGGRARTYTYGVCDRPETKTDPLGNVTRLTYDALCNLSLETDPLGQTTERRYSASGRLTELIEPTGDRWQFSYDARGNPSGSIDPLGHSITTTVSPAGELQTLTDRNGRRMDFEYDEAHRLVLETWNTVPPRVITYDYNAAGQLVSLTDPDSMLTLGYHATGLLASVDNSGTPGAPQVRIDYGYDGNGNLTTVSDSLGGLTTYGYDELDRPVSVEQSGTGVDPKRVEFLYDGTSQLSEIRRYSDLQAMSLVAKTDVLYDTQGNPERVSGMHHRGPLGQVLHDIDLVRDAAGNLTQMTDSEGQHTYTHSGAAALVSVTHPAGPQPAETYRYDGAGNRTFSHLSASHVYGRDLNEGGYRLRQDDLYDYEYDAEGNLTRRTSRINGAYTTYEWDHRNRLTRVTRFDNQDVQLGRVSYTYDAVDRRIRVTDGASVTHIAHDGDNPILELSPGGGVLVRRLYDRNLDGLLAEERSGAARWFLTDQVGSVRDLIAEDATTLAHHVYDSFGRLVSASGPDTANPLGFQGRPLDGTNGLLHLRAREYDPGTGRFISEDPLLPFRYDFPLNSPLRFTDPTGRTALLEYECLAVEALFTGLNASKLGKPVAATFVGIANAIKSGTPPPPGGGGGAGAIGKGIGDFTGYTPPEDADDVAEEIIETIAAGPCAAVEGSN
jgi:RHS repeat-associated protein